MNAHQQKLKIACNAFVAAGTMLRDKLNKALTPEAMSVLQQAIEAHDELYAQMIDDMERVDD
jgi:hypothetical protein